jgi:DNA mismatch endonuclease Vsr
LLRRRDRNKWAARQHSPTTLKGKDRLSRERRSWNMSRIRGKDTTPEKIVRSLLHRLGYRFRLHVRIPIETPLLGLRAKPRGTTKTIRVAEGRVRADRKSLGADPGGEVSRSRKLSTLNSQPSTIRFVRPDILLPKYKTAIFVHGCFWHRHQGCKNCTTPTNRREWWLAKLNGNAARDKRHQAALRKLGWRVMVIWECEAE